MNWAHVHLILNHFPVVGLAFGLALLAASVARRNSPLARVGLGVLVAIALIAIPVYLTGEPAEEMIEHLPGVSKSFIEEHEESALPTLIVIELLGMVAAVGLFRFRQTGELPRWFLTATLLLSIGAGGFVGWTANLGGQIRHPEIRTGFQLSGQGGEGPAARPDEERGEEEDAH
ncbi:MAG: hypothetical protein D6723_17690 [Acidobacteria bacterium]|nr:MAG: hypothetical protein D6723_17690 [Acidobacteriota bacterium]